MERLTTSDWMPLLLSRELGARSGSQNALEHDGHNGRVYMGNWGNAREQTRRSVRTLSSAGGKRRCSRFQSGSSRVFSGTCEPSAASAHPAPGLGHPTIRGPPAFPLCQSPAEGLFVYQIERLPLCCCRPIGRQSLLKAHPSTSLAFSPRTFRAATRGLLDRHPARRCSQCQDANC